MLVCIVTLRMKSPDGVVRTWRGQPADKDWDMLEVQKRLDCWTLLSHRREFCERNDLEEKKDDVELSAVNTASVT